MILEKEINLKPYWIIFWNLKQCMCRKGTMSYMLKSILCPIKLRDTEVLKLSHKILQTIKVKREISATLYNPLHILLLALISETGRQSRVWNCPTAENSGPSSRNSDNPHIQPIHGLCNHTQKKSFLSFETSKIAQPVVSRNHVEAALINWYKYE